MSTTSDLANLLGHHAVLDDEPAGARRRLSTRLEHRGRAVIVRTDGEVDAYTLPTWRRLLREAAATVRSGLLIVDTTGLDFMGYRGYVALAEESARCRHRGVQLRMVADRPVVARLLAAAGLSAELPIHADTDQALAQPEAEVNRSRAIWSDTGRSA
ncbi:anti-sigma factor antagonist [Nocardia sp. CDC159]|uniref:Anti-sigma factor antagonist n=1 Tax=Nocardia pulmonis TaxID=2951408 RepID=A0A9X2E2P2_9NOCA|nr:MULTISPECIES: anti-sigma factor antagonist [Nocardia]MCM6773157.1 anti-sigma factor antagonist [Nocardia pulmonis]MCM6785540.1 anti-sigma factor antagonist [Nocardia sp. CDC159]